MPDILVKPDNNDSASSILPYLPGPSGISSQLNFVATTFPMRFPLIIGAVAATPVGTAYKFFGLGRKYHAIQVAITGGSFNATVLIEGSLNGTDWTTIQSVTALGIYQYTGLYHSIRVSIPTYTSGTINVTALSQRD